MYGMSEFTTEIPNLLSWCFI